MARQETRSFDVPVVDDTDGTLVVVEECVGITVQMIGYVDGRWELHASLDGVHYAQIGMDLDANGVTSYPERPLRVRIHCQTAPAVVPPAPDPVPPVILLSTQYDRD